MPNFDSGHYFLTVILPIRDDILVRDDRTLTSPVHLVRAALATLPKARQSPATDDTGANHNLNSPFARSPRTHFARFVVIDDVIFGGRVPVDAIVGTLRGVDPTVARSCDQLSCPYLLFVADFDAASGDEKELKGYLDELWAAMPEELKAIFAQCYEFDKVRDKDSFARFIMKGQIETTMPFNDYWVDKPDLKTYPSGGTLKNIIYFGIGVIGALGLSIALILLWILLTVGGFFVPGPPGGFTLGVGYVAAGLFVISLIGAAILFALVRRLYAQVLQRGAAAFPAGTPCDLPSILKALYLQQKFQEFAVEAQRHYKNDAALHERFGAFLAEHKPSDRAQPTQPAGVVRS